MRLVFFKFLLDIKYRYSSIISFLVENDKIMKGLNQKVTQISDIWLQDKGNR